MDLYLRTSIDRDALADELLPMAKTHMRVEFNRDDEYITGTLRRAIDFFERTTEFAVFAAEYDWTPGLGLTTSSGTHFWPMPFPTAPSSIKVFDPDGVDQSVHYQLRSNAQDQFGATVLISLDGVPTYQPTTKVVLGYASADTLPPGILSFVLEAAMWFYENREIARMPGADGVPYLNQLLTAYWVPKA